MKWMAAIVMTALLWSVLAIHCVLSSHLVLSREPKPHRLLSPLAASHGASSSEEGALRMTGKAPGTCVAWAEPAVSFYCGSFSIELVYRTAVDAEREGPSGEMLALLSNLRVDNEQERASQNYGRHFQVLLDDRLGGEGAVMVQWLSRHWGAEGFVRSAKGIIDGRFHRIEVHRDAEAGTVELVVDGESVTAQLQAGVDLETQDQVTVIGGCFAGRYRTGDLGFLRLHTKQRELGGLLFQESDAVFSGASSFLMDGSPAANDFWWIGHPLLPKFVAEPLIRGHLPLCADGPHQPIEKDCWWDHHILHHSRNQNQHQSHLHNHSLQSPVLSSQPHVNRQHVVLSALLSSGGGSGTPSQDQDDFFAVPFYFLNFASDCRRLRLHCVVFCDESSLPRAQAALYSGPYLEFIHISQREGEPAVRGRVWAFLDHIVEHRPQHVVHLDLRDSRINRDPFPYLQQNHHCDLYVQIVVRSGIYCGGAQAGSGEWMEKLFRAWVEQMEIHRELDDQQVLNIVLGHMRGLRICNGSPVILPQHLKTYSKREFLEHGNWILDATANGEWGEAPQGDPPVVVPFTSEEEDVQASSNRRVFVCIVVLNFLGCLFAFFKVALQE